MGRQFDGFVNRCVLGNMGQKHELKRSEMENVPDTILHRVERGADEWGEQRIERPPVTEDTEDELRHEPGILTGEGDAVEFTIDQHFGRSEAWTLIVPIVGVESTAFERIWP